MIGEAPAPIAVVTERFFGRLKYEHLHRATIGDGTALAVEHWD